MQLIVLSNRKDQYLEATLASIEERVTGVDDVWVVDDSGDADWRSRIPADNVRTVGVEPQGYTRAMQRVFELADGDHFAFWEEDFVATAPIDLVAMGELLDERPHLAQVAVLRQPWWPDEVAAGGVLEAKAAEGHEIEYVDGVWEHRAFFTTNPTVLPRRTFERGWPDTAWSESRMGLQLLSRPDTRFGMLPGVRVEHVGERAGFGY